MAEGNEVVVKLEDKVIRHITAIQAHGNDDYPNRKLRYAADELAMDFDDDGLARKINGNQNASLVSTTDASETTVTADGVDLDFEPDGRESVLTRVAATGNGVVTSKPLAAPGRQLSETHVLRSQTLEMKMRPGGREMESVVTKAPGTLEFLPNLPAQHHRLLDGKDFVIAYGPGNRLDSFRANNVKTRTDPTAEERRRNRPASTTTSRDLEARFDPKTSRLGNMQQTGDFAYEEGDRRARAAKAGARGAAKAGTLPKTRTAAGSAARSGKAAGRGAGRMFGARAAGELSRTRRSALGTRSKAARTGAACGASIEDRLATLDSNGLTARNRGRGHHDGGLVHGPWAGLRHHYAANRGRWNFRSARRNRTCRRRRYHCSGC